MSDWLTVNPAEFNKPEQKKIHGMNVEVFVSPYDMPEAVRGTYAQESKIFTIEFRYIGGDESLEPVIQEGITAFVGKHSKRIYKIEFPIENQRAVGLRLIPEVLGRLQNHPSPRLGNYQVAKEILSKRGEKLFERSVVGF